MSQHMDSHVMGTESVSATLSEKLREKLGNCQSVATDEDKNSLRILQLHSN